LAPEAERRLAAILSADVAGYSRLMAADEEATVRRLGAYREQVMLLVRQQRGRLVDFTGDNFLAEFPSALDAVQAAVEIQRVLGARNAQLPPAQRLEFRIGVHLGDVRVEQGRLYGDGVNIAARLEQHAPPGGLCLSAAAHEQVASRVALAWQDLGALPLKNLPQPVRAWAARLPGAEAPRTQRRRPLRRAALAAAALLAVAALALWASWPAPLGWLFDAAGITNPPENPALPDQPSLVVLPFTNLSGDPGQEYFSDGITDELTTALARVPGLFVISRSSAFTYKGKPTRVEEVGRELGVRYVLEGSVRRAGDRLRISAQLSDARSGFQLWSEHYDRDLADVFALQSEIAEAITATVGIEIRDEIRERIRIRPTEAIGAYDAFLAAAAGIRTNTRRGIFEAKRLVETALAIDPDYVPAITMLAQIYLIELSFCWRTDASARESAVGLLNRSLELDPSHAGTYHGLGIAKLIEGRPEDALRHFERAIELSPSFDPPRLGLGLAQVQTGAPLDGLRTIQAALRLTPRPPPAAQGVLGYAQLRAGRVEEAIRIWEGVRLSNPDQLPTLFSLVSYYEGAGRHEEARALVAEIRRVNPELRADDVGTRCSVGGSAEDLTTTRENLRRAGLP
jgi:TolB-like protein/class 3 adenylate cyclase/Tfp pilus assembly protein PilF